MPTPLNIGIDVAAIAAPLVDLGFGIAGSARVSASLTLIGVRVYNPRTDAMDSADTVVADLPGLLYSRSESETAASPDLREAELMLNASDLREKGVPANVHPKQNDKAVINGVAWTIYERRPVPTDTIYLLRVRK